MTGKKYFGNLTMTDQEYTDRIAFCRTQVAAALKRGDEKNAQEWQELVEMWQTAAHFDEVFPKPGAEVSDD